MVARSAPSLVPVEAVVTGEGDDGVVDRYGSTEELDAVVLVGEHFHVVDGGA